MVPAKFLTVPLSASCGSAQSAPEVVWYPWAETGTKCHLPMFTGSTWTRPCRLIDERARSSRQSRVVKQVPKRRVRVGDASDHQKSSPKLRNMSDRLASISSADGACPYFAKHPAAALERNARRLLFEGRREITLKNLPHITVGGNAMRIRLHFQDCSKLLRKFYHHGRFSFYDQLYRFHVPAQSGRSFQLVSTLSVRSAQRGC